MRVLQLVKTAKFEWALRQMRQLASLGVDVHVAMPLDGPLVAQYEAAGIQIHPIQTDFPIRKPWRWPRISSDLRRLVARLQPDILHSHFVGTTLTARIALGKNHPLPRLFQVAGPLHLEHPVFRRGELATSGSSDHWIASCRWTQQRYLTLGIPEDRVFLSYYGTDLDRVVPAVGGKLRQEFGIPPATKLVGMVAMIYSPKRFLGQRRGLKGHEDLIDALKICLETRNDFLGVFIGGSAWNIPTAYENEVRNYGREKLGDKGLFLGTRSDVYDLYPDLDVVVHPSHSENVGGAVESFLLGVPTIATAVGGLPDLVESGETGWLVPKRDPSKLAEAILEALADPEQARQRARKGQAKTRVLFDVRRTSREILEIYETILRRGSEGADRLVARPATIAQRDQGNHDPMTLESLS